MQGQVTEACVLLCRTHLTNYACAFQARLPGRDAVDSLIQDYGISTWEKQAHRRIWLVAFGVEQMQCALGA